MSKYEQLWKYLEEGQEVELSLSYEEIEKNLGVPIDHLIGAIVSGYESIY
ncbi:hypothetical protein IGI37_001107 [Enterococcus sp. AZ194]